MSSICDKGVANLEYAHGGCGTGALWFNKVLQEYGMLVIMYDHESEVNLLRGSENRFPMNVS